MTMRLLHFRAERDLHAYLVHCHHGYPHGIDVQIGSRRWRWLWRLCK